MSPEIDPHPTTLEETLIKKLVGPPKHRTAWEVSRHSIIKISVYVTHDMQYIAMATAQ